MEDIPNTEQLRASDNKVIADRIQQILERHHASDRSVVFARSDEKTRCVSLNAAITPDSYDYFNLGEEFGQDPATRDFFVPIYSFHILDYGEEHEVMLTTPYGRWKDNVIGKDGHLYAFNNVYVFDSKGHGIKYEEVFPYSLNESIDPDNVKEFVEEVVGFDYNSIPKVDFTPKEEDSRYVDLDPEDYEMIFGYLQQIESGILILRK